MKPLHERMREAADTYLNGIGVIFMIDPAIITTGERDQ